MHQDHLLISIHMLSAHISVTCCLLSPNTILLLELYRLLRKHTAALCVPLDPHHSIIVTDLAGEVMVNSQAQGLFLQSDKGRWALLATSNFPIGPPKAGIRRHGASSTYSPKGHGCPDAVSYRSREGLVRRDIVCSLAHIPIWVAPGPSGTHGRGALLGLAVLPCGLKVMLHFCALRNKSW